jgi:hypothetical protein
LPTSRQVSPTLQQESPQGVAQQVPPAQLWPSPQQTPSHAFSAGQHAPSMQISPLAQQLSPQI